MSPFQKNLQKFLIIFFTAIPAIIIIVGIIRSKRGDSLTVAAPDQNQSNQGTTTVQPPAATTAPVGAVTFTGKTYQTPYGNVVASVTVANGKITAVAMPVVPNSPPSIYAEPYLVQQALTAGSANIQGVSGATFTSIAFKSSLENAISQASANGQTVTAGATTGTSTSIPSTSKPSVPRRYRDDD